MTLATPALANHKNNDTWESELSHFGGAILYSGLATAVAGIWWPEDRGWIGFGATTFVGVLVEGIPNEFGHNFSWLDIGATVAGAAVGAFVTDRWILSPVVAKDRADSTYFGLAARTRF